MIFFLQKVVSSQRSITWEGKFILGVEAEAGRELSRSGIRVLFLGIG